MFSLAPPISQNMKPVFYPILIILLAAGCIGDDVVFDEVDEAVRIVNPVDTIALGETYQFEAMYTNNVGVVEQVAISWSSNAPDTFSIDGQGLATALQKGPATITATVEVEGKAPVFDEITVVVDEVTVGPAQNPYGMLVSTSSYALTGSFEITDDGNGNAIITFSDDYSASTALPGLYVYLGNNPSSITNAIEIGLVEIFDGQHQYEVSGVGIYDNEYLLYWCKPFNVKVGEGVIQF